jgi:hypothetical protein
LNRNRAGGAIKSGNRAMNLCILSLFNPGYYNHQRIPH